MRIARIAGLLALAFARAGLALECEEMTYEAQEYSLCHVDFQDDEIALYLADEQGEIYGSMAALRKALEAQGASVEMAMNAGMYHQGGAPVGLYQDQNGEAQSLMLREGPGNFGLLPNGVFCKAADRFIVANARAFADADYACSFATQSGPMLVIDGELHPRFLVDSDSRYVRNGVGVNADGSEALLVISHQPVTFYEFGSLFRDALKTPNALYFDGSVSQLYQKDGRNIGWPAPLGPILAVTKVAGAN